MRKLNLLFILGLLFLPLSGHSFAQGPGEGKAGPGWPMGRMYDPRTVETLRGKLVAVDTIDSGRPEMPGRITLSLKTDKETVTIYLGPVWYIEAQGVKLEPQDQVEVKGSRVILEDKPLIIASYVKKGDKVMNLRDDQGTPLWRGGPKR